MGGIDEWKEDEDGSSARGESPEDVHCGIVGKSHSLVHVDPTCHIYYLYMGLVNYFLHAI